MYYIGILSREDLTEYLYRVTGGGMIDTSTVSNEGVTLDDLDNTTNMVSSSNAEVVGIANSNKTADITDGSVATPPSTRQRRTGKSCLSDDDIEYMVDQVNVNISICCDYAINMHIYIYVYIDV